jgi:hypothetical protein
MHSAVAHTILLTLLPLATAAVHYNTTTTTAHTVTAASEVMWLHPDYAPRYLWDSSLGGQDSYKQTGAEVRGLVARAFRGPLPPAQQQQVLTELQADRYYHTTATACCYFMYALL